MKQHITKEQWDEISKEQKVKFCKSLYSVNDIMDKAVLVARFNQVKKIKSIYDFRPNIWQMIAFLGDGYIGIVYNRKGNVILKRTTAENLCDELWKAAKYKLTKTK